MSAARLPYLLRSLHKGTQRLVLLAACASTASAAKTTTAVRLAAAYGDPLFEMIDVSPPDRERILSYISKRALVREYADRANLKGSPTIESIRQRLLAGGRLVPRQDWLLSDPTLESCTGRQQRDGLVRTVGTCQELGLIHPTTCVLLSYGALLVVLARDEGVLQGLAAEGPNPFRSSVPYSMAAFFQVARSDWRLISPLLKSIPAKAQTSFSEVCTSAERIVGAVTDGIPRNVTTHDIHDWLKRQRETAARLNARTSDRAARGGSSVQTLYRPLEDLFVPRLEMLTDVGLLTKPDSCWRYIYERAPSSGPFLEMLSQGGAGLETRYFSAIAHLHGRKARELAEPESILTHLRPAYARLRARNGYAPITEAVVYANARAWSSTHETWAFVELEPAVQALRLLAGASSPSVRLMADRFRKPFTFSVVADS